MARPFSKGLVDPLGGVGGPLKAQGAPVEERWNKSTVR